MRLLVLVTMLAMASTTGASAAGPVQDLAPIVRTSLQLAPAYFKSAVGTAYDKSEDEQAYHVSGPLARLCPKCYITDEYASPDHHERWVVNLEYAVPKGWTDARAAEYVIATVGPLVREFTLKTGDDDGKSYFDWKRGKTFVYIETFGSQKSHVLSVRIGQYTQKDVHVEKFSTPLTAAQKTQLTADVKNFLALGLANAAQNFTTLRGKSYGSDVYGSNVSFDELLTDCGVDGVIFRGSETGVSSKWIFSCKTPSLADGKSTFEPFLKAAIWNALPGSFHEATDETERGLSDYRWDDSSETSVMLDSYADGSRTQYTISIYHFIPNP